MWLRLLHDWASTWKTQIRGYGSNSWRQIDLEPFSLACQLPELEFFEDWAQGGLSAIALKQGLPLRASSQPQGTWIFYIDGPRLKEQVCQ